MSTRGTVTSPLSPTATSIDRRDIGHETLVCGDAETVPLGSLRPQPAALRDELHHPAQSPGVDRV